MQRTKRKVYEGHEQYVFVSYAHADRDAALPIIRALVAEGYRVWYDDGVQIGSRYPDYIARHVLGCACFVALLSEASKVSEWCEQEAHYALDLHKPVLPVYLEEVELEPGLCMRLGTRQAMRWYDYASEAAFLAELFAVRMLDRCLTDEGRRGRGVKPRAVESRAYDAVGFVSKASVAEGTGAKAERLGASVRVEPKRVLADLADYSWDELKELSRAIAAAGTDAEGLDIAKAYGLVDKDGKLRGETKAVTLKDRRKTTAQIRILGFRHDDLAGGGKAGISFEFTDVPAKHCMNPKSTNRGGWEASEMRGWLNDGRSGFLSLLPDDLRPLVETASKRTNNRGRVRENDTACVTVTDDRLWLLSMSEVYGKLSAQWEIAPWSPATYDAEGEQYQLYADKGVSTSSYDFCKKDGACSWWWLRSPSASGTNWFHSVFRVGGWYDGYAVNEWGVSPGFCF